MKKIVKLMILLACFSTTTQAKCQGVVNADKLNVRENTSLNSVILEKIDENEKIEVIDVFGEWYKINTGNTKGFVKGEFINLKTFPGYVDCESINVRTLPEAGSEAAGYLTKDTEVEIFDLVNDFYKIEFNGNEAFVQKDLISTQFVKAIEKRSADIKENPGEYKFEKLNLEIQNKGESIKSTAYKYLGNPYAYGGQDLNRGIDCSSFTQQIYAKNGISIPRTASEQAASKGGIPLDQLVIGDLIFFARSVGSVVCHVGIYIGNNQMIHAGSDQTGITIDNIYKMGELQIVKATHY